MIPAPPTLQERVRIFNLGTPTPMHVGTHELVNDLWREVERLRAGVAPLAQRATNFEQTYSDCDDDDPIEVPLRELRALRSAIAAAVGDRPAAAQPQNHREGESKVSAEQKREGPSSTGFTVVFDGDVRALPFNPFKAETQFGKVLSVGIGDAHAINDSMLAALQFCADEKNYQQRGWQGDAA